MTTPNLMLIASIIENNNDVLKQVLDKYEGELPDVPGYRCLTYLMLACTMENKEAVRMILEKYKNNTEYINRKCDGISAFMLANETSDKYIKDLFPQKELTPEEIKTMKSKPYKDNLKLLLRFVKALVMELLTFYGIYKAGSYMLTSATRARLNRINKSKSPKKQSKSRKKKRSL